MNRLLNAMLSAALLVSLSACEDPGDEALLETTDDFASAEDEAAPDPDADSSAGWSLESSRNVAGPEVQGPAAEGSSGQGRAQGLFGTIPSVPVLGTICKHSSGGSPCISLYTDIVNLADLRWTDGTTANDSVSSIHVAPGQRITLCEHSQHRGRCIIMEGNLSSTGYWNLPDWFNDVTSSVKVVDDWVGVIPTSSTCPSGTYRSSEIFMDCEDDDNRSRASGFKGGVYLTNKGNAHINTCMVPGSGFKSLAPYSSSQSNYAVLKLGKVCPNGSIEVIRFFDNEDSDTSNRHNENIWPNEVGKNTRLHLCLFNGSANTGSQASGLPSLGLNYGVFAGPNMHQAFAKEYGYVRTDDQDDEDPWWSSAFSWLCSAVGELVGSIGGGWLGGPVGAAAGGALGEYLASEAADYIVGQASDDNINAMYVVDTGNYTVDQLKTFYNDAMGIIEADDNTKMHMQRVK